MAVLVVLTVSWIGYSIAVQRQFFADGSHFFLKLLEDRWFIYGVDYARHHSHGLTQCLMVALMVGFDVRDVEVLSWAFGIGLHLPFLIGLAASYLAVRSVDARLLILPVLGLYGISANQAFMMVHESHVTASLFWPLLLFVVLWDRYDWPHAVVVIVVSVLFIRTYETVAMLGALLLVLLAVKMRAAWRGTTLLTRWVWVVLVAVLALGIAIAAWASVFTRHPGARGELAATVASARSHWPLLLSAGYLAAVGLVLAGGTTARARRAFLGVGTLLAAGSAVVAVLPAVSPELLRPGLHYWARGVLVLMPLVLAVPAVLLARRAAAVSDLAWGRAWTLVVLLAAGQASWHVLASAQWSGFRRIFREELAAHAGPTRFEATSLGAERAGIQLVRPLVWGFTQPTLSILWARRPAVETLIVNPASEDSRWQPFDPLDPAGLPKVERYGYSFEPYLARLRAERAQGRPGPR